MRTWLCCRENLSYPPQHCTWSPLTDHSLCACSQYLCQPPFFFLLLLNLIVIQDDSAFCLLHLSIRGMTFTGTLSTALLSESYFLYDMPPVSAQSLSIRFLDMLLNKADWKWPLTSIWRPKEDWITIFGGTIISVLRILHNIPGFFIHWSHF